MRNRNMYWADWLQNSDPFIPPTAEISSLDDIERVCPELRQILDEAQAIRQRRRADWNDYARLKRRLKSLIGWWSPDHRLQTCEAYELSIRALADALHI